MDKKQRKKEADRKYRENNRERLLKQQRAYYRKNRRKLLDQMKKKRQQQAKDPKWVEKQRTIKRDWMRKWYKENPEEKRAYSRRKSYERVRSKGYEDYFKDNARKAVERAIKRGEMTREPCVECSSEPAQGHHEDYSKLLEVIWLCQVCHAKRHRIY